MTAAHLAHLLDPPAISSAARLPVFSVLKASMTVV